MTDERFDIIEPLGSGGMATVWRARDRRLDREIALKRPLPHLAEEPDALARFEREGRAAAALSHPNIVAVYDAGEDDEGPWLAMELVHGISVRRIIDRDGPLAIDRIVDYVRQAAGGLDAAHERGVIHRDIKPENLLVGDDGRIRITDFGLARPAIHQTPITQEGAVVGSVRYLAPEVLTGEQGPSADIYSLAAVAYEMLTARPPLDAPTIATLLDRIRTEPPAPPSTLRPVGPALDHEFARALSKSVAERPSTAMELANGLAAAAGATVPLVAPVVAATPTHVMAAAPSGTPSSPTGTTIIVPPQPASPGPRLPWALKATLTGVGLVAAVLIGVALADDGSPPTAEAAAPTTTLTDVSAPTSTSAPTTTLQTTTTSAPTTTTTTTTTTTLTLEAAIVSLVAEISDALDAAAPRALKPKEARDVGKDVNEAAGAFLDGDLDKAEKKLNDAAETVNDKVDEDSVRQELLDLLSSLAELMGFEDPA